MRNFQTFYNIALAGTIGLILFIHLVDHPVPTQQEVKQATEQRRERDLKRFYRSKPYREYVKTIDAAYVAYNHCRTYEWNMRNCTAAYSTARTYAYEALRLDVKARGGALPRDFEQYDPRAEARW